jgi:hypothetical protein
VGGVLEVATFVEVLCDDLEVPGSVRLEGDFLLGSVEEFSVGVVVGTLV